MWTESAPVTEWRLEATRGGDEEVRFIFSLQRQIYVKAIKLVFFSSSSYFFIMRSTSNWKGFLIDEEFVCLFIIIFSFLDFFFPYWDIVDLGIC